jgi:hypothetical protein
LRRRCWPWPSGRVGAGGQARHRPRQPGGPVEAGGRSVAANRILADQGVLDGFGHVSTATRAIPPGC